MADIDNTEPTTTPGQNATPSEPSTAPEVKDAPEQLTTPTTDEPTPAAEPETDKAVDDIMKKDGDDVLEAQDAAGQKAVVMKTGHWQRFKDFMAGWWGSPRKRWITIGAIIIVLAAVGLVPFTRYNVAGLVMKASVTVRAVDSKTGAPVSGAKVELAGQAVETDANGKAVLHVRAGSKTLQVSKQYYTGSMQKELVALSGNSFKASLVALGRQVKVKVVNKVTGKPVADALVNGGGAKGKTDKNGMATLVLGSGTTIQEVSVSLGGYNTAKVHVTAAGDVAKNTFSITPAGKLYFLSNLSGKIDVVKTNLDGTDRQTVLAGTGTEDRNSTSLLASRDWKYLALLSKRSGSNASLYLIDTTNNDGLTTIDEGNANFSLVGWSGDRFIYKVFRNTVSQWQPNQQALKSFDPTTGHTLLLDQTQGSGTGSSDFAQQSFGTPYLMGNQVVYAKGWNASYYNYSTELAGKTAELDTVGADGSGHKVLKTFTPGSSYSYIDLSANLYEPEGLYLNFEGSFYKYDDGKVTTTTDVNNETFDSGSYPTYLLSPSGNSVFWADQRDGKNTLFVGDEDAEGQKQIASLSDYNTYGWFTDDYLLVSKNSSELYVMPAAGGTPLKITDYYKPAINYNGYGGGYGGL